jgi:hypothetical protein
MSERIEFIDIALQERRTLETALAELVAKLSVVRVFETTSRVK